MPPAFDFMFIAVVFSFVSVYVVLPVVSFFRKPYCSGLITIIIIIIILFFFFFFRHGLSPFNCSGIDALPSFPGASTICSSSGFVVEVVFRESVVVHSFKMVDQTLFVFGYYVLYSTDLKFFSYDSKPYI
jgi:hypothetical protein